jgi:ATP-dependent DNA ligase
MLLSGSLRRPEPVTSRWSMQPELLASCEKMCFKGIVSKRADSVYRAGPTDEWVKIKTAAWKAANADRFEMMRKGREKTSQR